MNHVSAMGRKVNQGMPDVREGFSSRLWSEVRVHSIQISKGCGLPPQEVTSAEELVAGMCRLI